MFCLFIVVHLGFVLILWVDSFAFFLSLGFDFESNRIELNGCDFFFSIPFLFSIYHWWWVLFIRHSGELVVDTSTHIIHSEKIYIFGIRGVYIIIIIFIWYFGQNLFLGKKKTEINKKIEKKTNRKKTDTNKQKSL